jgi:hypothetical protein
MMIKLLKNNSLPLIALIILSCSKNGFLDSGKNITREVFIERDFSSIDIKNMFDITLVQDTVKKVFVTCGEHLQRYVSVTVRDTILLLDHTAKFNWSRKYEKIKLEIHLVTTPRIDIHEPVKLKTMNTLKGGNFIFKDWSRVSEADISLDVRSCGIFMVSDNFGYIKLKGKSTSAYLEGWGTCQLRADSLTITNCYIQHRGLSNIYVNVTAQLIVSLEFTGNVCYTGHPGQLIVVKQTSSGRLIDMNP